MNWSTCIDWLAFTMPASQSIDRHPLWHTGKREIRPLYGYDSGVQTDEGVMLFLHSARPDMGIYVQYSGAALQNLAPMTPLHALTYHMGMGHTAKRVDLALDVFDTGIRAGDIEQLYNDGAIKTHAKQGTLIRHDTRTRGEGYYIGSLKKRKKLLRCYNKGAQLKLDADWFRFELQCSNTAAPSIAETLYTRGDNPDILIGAILGYAHIPHPALIELLDTPALKIPHRYEPHPDAALEQAFKTIPKWVARLMLRYSPFVLDALLEQIVIEYAKVDSSINIEIKINTNHPDTNIT